MARKRTIAAVAALSLVGASVAAAPAIATSSTDYERITIDSASTGAAFTVSGNLADNPRPELVVSAFGQFQFGPSGPDHSRSWHGHHVQECSARQQA